LIGDGQKDEIGHESDGIAGGPVFAGFFVVFLVELADEFFEDGAHGVVVDAGGAEVDVRIEEFVDEGAERVGFGEGGELVTEFEVFDDFLDVGGEAVEVVFEILQELLLAGAGFEGGEGELGIVVEGLLRGFAEGGVLFGDAVGVKELLWLRGRLVSWVRGRRRGGGGRTWGG
jgi:hypothetical protein